jgi:DNA-directed RNA polymerase specialized sigma24 family protein
VQASLARTYVAWRRLDDPANAEAYTRKVMYRLQVSWWRRRKLLESVTADLPEPRHEGGDPTDAADARIVLRAALLLDVAVGTVKSQTARGLARLRAMAPELGDPHTQERSR